MVPYGTGTVSNDGTEFIADADPGHPGHGYGLVHFDWHGPMPGPPPVINPSPDGGAPHPPPPTCNSSGSGDFATPTPLACSVGSPVDLSSGIVYYTSSDLQIAGGRGSIAISRYYRTLATYQGPFGIGTAHNDSYALNDANSRLAAVNDSVGGVFGFSFDADGHVLTQEEPTGVVEYTRDALGRVATRQVTGQAAVQYNYDAAGNMLSAATSAVGVTYKYDSRNLPQSLTRTNGVVTNYAFDPLGQVLPSSTAKARLR